MRISDWSSDVCSSDLSGDPASPSSISAPSCASPHACHQPSTGQTPAAAAKLSPEVSDSGAAGAGRGPRSGAAQPASRPRRTAVVTGKRGMASNDTVWYHAPHSEWSKVVNRNDTSQYGFWGRCRGAAAQGVRRGGAQGVFGERLCGHNHVVDRERGRWVEDEIGRAHV